MILFTFPVLWDHIFVDILLRASRAPIALSVPKPHGFGPEYCFMHHYIGNPGKENDCSAGKRFNMEL
jgi:hypothetical protein